MLPLLLLASAGVVAEARTVLLTPSAPTPTLPDCLKSSYHGVYGGKHVFISDDDCASLVAPTAFDEGSLVPDYNNIFREIVWVGYAGVRDAPKGYDALKDAWEQISKASDDFDFDAAIEDFENIWSHDYFYSGSKTQTPFLPMDAQADFMAQAVAEPMPEGSEPDESWGLTWDLELVDFSESGLFISVPKPILPLIDTFLPPHLVAVGVAPTPVPLSYEVPEHYAKNLADITKNLKFDVKIASAVGSIQADEIKKDVRYLTGEDSDIVSRHSFTQGARVAAKWIKEKMEKTGAECEYFEYLMGFSPDVICTYPSRSNSTERVILSGHYDSRGTFGNVRAPGADDDGSGSSHVLAIARAIESNKITFDKSVSLVFFSGEEQGLWGSHYFAKHLSEKKETVILQIQADMLAYRVPGEPMQLGLPATIELPEAGFLVGNLSRMYAPELVVGRTEACCSDHQSFLSYGYPSTQVFERNGWIADPMYHNSGDLSEREGYDFEQIASIAKVTMSAILEVGGAKVGKKLGEQ